LTDKAMMGGFYRLIRHTAKPRAGRR